MSATALVGGYGAVLALLLALALDLAAGELPNSLHPVALMGRWIAGLWDRRPEGTVPGLIAYGALIVVSGLALFAGPWGLIALALRGLGQTPGGQAAGLILTALALKQAFSLRELVAASDRIRNALEDGDLAEARHLVGFHLVSRPTAALSSELVVAATVESLAENLTDSLAAPLLYHTVAGLPGAWGYRYVNTCDSMLGYREEEKEWGGKVSARLDTVLNWVPARVTGFVLVAAAALTGADARGALRTMLAQHRRTASPNAGWTMAAMAGALGVTLEKAGHYVLEGGTGPLGPGTILLCRRVVAVAAALLVVMSCGALILLVPALWGTP